MTGEFALRPGPAIGAALGAAAFGAPAFASPISHCVPSAEKAAIAAVARSPAIGQETVYGSPYEAGPGVLRFEVDVFGPQSMNYRVDVTVDGACKVLGTSALLINNPWNRP
jgi:hypothetical protein